MATVANNASPIPAAVQDVAIVGGGVVGCAMARECVARGLRVILLEKATDLLDGASKGNSAILHTGFDAPTGSLEQQCIAEGYRQYLEVADKFGLPVLRSGALVVAWNEQQAAQLDSIRQKALANGVSEVAYLPRSALRGETPGLSREALAALHVAGEFIIDPWTTPHAYMLQAIEHGARLVRDCELMAGSRSGALWHLSTSLGELRAHTVINCAGLYGDIVEQCLTGETTFMIKPRKGQFVVYDKAASSLSSRILLPVPQQHTKGVVVCPTIYGNLLVGPTAEEQQDRGQAAIDSTTLAGLQRRGQEILPALLNMPVTATYAGLRPATERPEYRIRFDPAGGYVAVGGIRSTGLSAALGIARYVNDELAGQDKGWRSPEKPAPPLRFPRVPVLAEHGVRDWQKAGNGGVVCHCELVTRREIENALSGPLAATSLAGLKRRTRATLGRCQGFYCSAALSQLTEGKLSPAIAIDSSSGG